VCVGDVIVLNTLRYADEIRPADELKVPAPDAKNATISDKELKMAVALVEGMSEEWEPEQYHDTYREDVLALVEKKVAAKETKTITMPGKEAEPARSSNVIDLVSLLQASIGKKPAKAAVGEDDDNEPPPRKKRKTTDEEPEEAEAEAEAPAARARKAPAKSTERIAASAEKRTGTKTAASKTAAKAPARRKKAA
jgi:DNA end-binding protein Ku